MSGHFRTAIIAVLMVMTFSVVGLFAAPEALAQVSKKGGCTNCHSSKNSDANAEITFALDGVEQTITAAAGGDDFNHSATINVPINTPFEIDYLVFGANRDTGADDFLATPIYMAPLWITDGGTAPINGTNNSPALANWAASGVMDGNHAQMPTWKFHATANTSIAAFASLNMHIQDHSDLNGDDTGTASSWHVSKGIMLNNNSDADGTMYAGADFIMTTPPTAGTYVFYLIGGGGDGAGAKGYLATQLTINVTAGPADSTAPIANNDIAVSPESTTFVPAAFTITGTFTDAESAVSACDYTLNGGGAWTPGVVSGAGPYTCTANPTGQTNGSALTINMRATSAGGGPTVSTAINRTVDTLAPTTTDNVPAGWQTVNTTVTLTPTDAGSGVASTVYCVDTANACVPGTAYAAPFVVSNEATNYVRYRSTDNLGNVQTVVSATLQLDKTAPTDGALAPTPGDTQISLLWSAATDATSGLTSPAYKVVMATGTTTPPADCSGVAIYTGDLVTHTELGLTNGVDYAFRVCATDVAGLISGGATATAQPASGNAVPNVPVTLGQFLLNGTTPIAIGGYSTEASVIFKGDISDADGGDTVKLQIDLDSNGIFDCESVLLANPSNGVQVTCAVVDGAGYNWQARVVDNNATASAWTPFNAANPDFTSDQSAPSVTTTVPANSATGIGLDSSVTINFDENVNCGTVNTTNITSTSPGWTFSSCSAAQAIFTTSGQAALTAYSVNVTTAVTDVAGNAISAAYPFSYTTSGICTPAQPTVTVAPGTLSIPNDGGLAVFTVTITNNDSSFCSPTTFTLSTGDSNGAEFYASTLDKADTGALASNGGSTTASLTVQVIPGFDSVTNNTTVTATDSPTHDPPVTSTAVTTNVALGGGCVGSGINPNASAGGTFIQGR